MSDSVDRVFSHALNTVNKIRSGSEKPPASIRHRLYGLYKQSMEGDVDGIMERPSGTDEESRIAQDKWDAWKAQNGLSRTEAKRRYISTLLDTMHQYASRSPDARELIAELEFVWDQVKSNVSSSSSSSPLQMHATGSGSNVHLQNPPPYSQLGLSTDSRNFKRPMEQQGEQPMRVLSPLSQSDEEDLEDNAEEFVDAPDSQFDERRNSDDSKGQENSQEQAPKGIQNPEEAQPGALSDQRWRRRVERALVKMTAEVAALREQLESQRLFGRRKTIFGWIWKISLFVAKHIAVDLVVLLFVLIWMRRRKDRRLVGALQMLFGDAVTQIQKAGNAQIKNIGRALPKLPSKKS